MVRRLDALLRPSTSTTWILGLGLVAIGIASSALVWDALPADLVIQWDAHGEAGDTVAKEIGAVVLPLVSLGVLGLFAILPRIDPLGDNIHAFSGYYNGFFLLIVAFLTAIHGVILAENLGHDVAILGIMVVAVGVIFVYTGALLRNAKPNWFVGIRTPWTLSSERVWHRTHQVSARLFTIGGVILLGVGIYDLLVGVGELVVFVIVAVALVVAIASAGYSYIVYVQLDEPTDRP